MFCPECGTENVEHAKFCSNCGTKIDLPNSFSFIQRKKEENRGIVGYLGLTEWFDSLAESEKTIIRDSYKDSEIYSREVDSGKIISSSETQIFFLHSVANRLGNAGLENRKIEILIDSLDKEGTSIDKHFVFTELIDIYGQKVDFKSTLHYSELDMDLIKKNEELKAFLKEAVIPSIDYFNELNEYKKLINPLTDILNKNEIVIQKDLYTYPEFEGKRKILSSFLYWLDKGNYITRSKKGNSYEVKLKTPLTKIFS